MSEFIIYHNPRCSKSRQALEILRAHGIQPRIVEYLKHPLDVAGLNALRKKLGLAARDILRENEAEYRQLHLDASAKTDADRLAAIAQHPILLQRPIIVRGDRAVIGRPPERVKELI